MDLPEASVGLSAREENILMIEDSASKLLRGQRTRARQQRFGAPEISLDAWSDLLETGWTLTRIPEDEGGLGLGLSELAKIAQKLGQELVPEPVQWVALIAPFLPEKERDLVLSGDRIVLPAFAAIKEAPEVQESGVTGATEYLSLPGVAHAFLVQTITGAALIEADAAGLAIEKTASHDGSHIGRLHLHNTPFLPIEANMGALCEEAGLLQAAYLTGIAESAFEITREYLCEREQFGRPIGSFQSLQHRMVDLYLELSLMRAALERATNHIDDHDMDENARRYVSLAKYQASRSARRITQAAIQLHGGIGYTDEADIGLYLRKAITLSGLNGSEHFHVNRAFTLREAV